MEKIKQMLFSSDGQDKINVPLVIILISLVVVAIVLGIVKYSKAESKDVASIEENIIENQIQEPEQNDDFLIVNIQEIEEQQEVTEEEKKQAKYFIRINYTQNVVTIYTKDSEGNYTQPYKAMVCSTGTATPRSGTYTTTDKYTWGKLFGNVWGQYCTRIVGSILFHSVPYTDRDKSTLEYWEYDKLGTSASAGCIRLTVEDAKWIFNNCSAGTQVEFYSDSNPGPYGKPTAKKISEHETVRSWDPTDPDANNPWKTYDENANREEPETTPTEPNPQEQKPSQNVPETPTPGNKEENPEQQPEIPTEPENPGIPTNPGDEEETVNPDTPTEPSNPTEPEETPTNPLEPETPTDPEAPGEGENPETPEEEKPAKPEQSEEEQQPQQPEEPTAPNDEGENESKETSETSEIES